MMELAFGLKFGGGEEDDGPAVGHRNGGGTHDHDSAGKCMPKAAATAGGCCCAPGQSCDPTPSSKPAAASVSVEEDPMDEDGGEEAREAKRAKAEAVKEKEAGNEAYKKKDFDVALKHYNRAMELDPTDLSYMTNRSAVYFETKQFDACIADCDLAVEKGREVRADYKLIAKALARKASALVQLGR